MVEWGYELAGVAAWNQRFRSSPVWSEGFIVSESLDEEAQVAYEWCEVEMLSDTNETRRAEVKQLEDWVVVEVGEQLKLERWQEGSSCEVGKGYG